MKQATMYSTDACPFCKMAVRLLAARGLEPVEIKIDRDDARRVEMIEKTGRRTVPQIFLGTLHVGGYDDLVALDRSGALDALL